MPLPQQDKEIQTLSPSNEDEYIKDAESGGDHRVIEAGCKTVIGSRLKRSGMFRTVRGANAILALRCRQLNGRFEDYWEARRAA